MLNTVVRATRRDALIGFGSVIRLSTAPGAQPTRPAPSPDEAQAIADDACVG